MEAHALGSRIRQTYLLAEPGTTERVRMRSAGDTVCYTHTIKRKLSAMRRLEDEQEIGSEEYQRLLERADPERNTIEKERWVLPYLGQNFEIDVFPFWKNQAYLELELRDETQEIIFPPEITILREVTEDKRYTNAALARQIPAEDEEGEWI